MHPLTTTTNNVKRSAGTTWHLHPVPSAGPMVDPWVASADQQRRRRYLAPRSVLIKPLFLASRQAGRPRALGPCTVLPQGRAIPLWTSSAVPASKLPAIGRPAMKGSALARDLAIVGTRDLARTPPARRGDAVVLLEGEARALGVAIGDAGFVPPGWPDGRGMSAPGASRTRGPGRDRPAGRPRHRTPRHRPPRRAPWPCPRSLSAPRWAPDAPRFRPTSRGVPWSPLDLWVEQRPARSPAGPSAGDRARHRLPSAGHGPGTGHGPGGADGPPAQPRRRDRGAKPGRPPGRRSWRPRQEAADGARNRALRAADAARRGTGPRRPHPPTGAVPLVVVTGAINAGTDPRHRRGGRGRPVREKPMPPPPFQHLRAIVLDWGRNGARLRQPGAGQRLRRGLPAVRRHHRGRGRARTHGHGQARSHRRHAGLAAGGGGLAGDARPRAHRRRRRGALRHLRPADRRGRGSPRRTRARGLRPPSKVCAPVVSRSARPPATTARSWSRSCRSRRRRAMPQTAWSAPPTCRQGGPARS